MLALVVIKTDAHVQLLITLADTSCCSILLMLLWMMMMRMMMEIGTMMVVMLSLMIDVALRRNGIYS